MHPFFSQKQLLHLLTLLLLQRGRLAQAGEMPNLARQVCKLHTRRLPTTHLMFLTE